MKRRLARIICLLLAGLLTAGAQTEPGRANAAEAEAAGSADAAVSTDTAASLDTVALASTAVSPAVSSAAAPRGRALVVYERPDSAEARRQAEAVVRQVLYLGVSCDVEEQERYRAGSAKEYAEVVAVGHAGGALNRTLRSDLTSYAGPLALVGPGLGAAAEELGTPAGAAAEFSAVRTVGDGAPVSRTLSRSVAGELCAPAGLSVWGTASGTDAVRSTPVSGAFAYRKGRLWRFTLTDGLDADPVLGRLLQDFLGGFFGRPGLTPGLYFSLGWIYPVSDFSTIARMGEDLRKRGVPFTFTVMPFYQNADTEAAAMYGQLLRELAACGGTPVIHLPVYNALNEGGVPAVSDMTARLARALRNYVSLGVAPAALELPEETLFYPGFTGFLTRTDELFTMPGDGKDTGVISSGAGLPELPAGPVSLSAGAAAVRGLPVPANERDWPAFYRTAADLASDRFGRWRVVCPSTLPYEKFQKLVDGLLLQGAAFSDFGVGSSTLSLPGAQVTVTDGFAAFNGRAVSAPASPASSGTASSGAKPGPSGADDWPFLALSAVILGILTAALVVNWRKNRRKFVKRG